MGTILQQTKRTSTDADGEEMKELEFIDCSLSRCKWKRKLQDIEPKYLDLNKKYSDKIVEMENYSIKFRK